MMMMVSVVVMTVLTAFVNDRRGSGSSRLFINVSGCRQLLDYWTL
jgi:hypothetical protein